jgi:hypothetical protein
MTDHPDEPDEQLDPASPEDEARIRALLAGARATGPVPADVAARLDGVLADLSAGRVTVDPVPADNVVPITRTRRHRIVTVLGVAAAIGVFGLGVGAVLNSEPGENDAASTDSAVADRGGDAGMNEEAEAAPTESGNELGPGDEPGAEDDKVVLREHAFVVRPEHLTQDLARIQSALPAPGAADYSRGMVHAPKGFGCRLTTPDRGILIGVEYDGAPAFVRFLEPMGDSQVVEVLQCGTGDLVRSTTLPTPR